MRNLAVSALVLTLAFSANATPLKLALPGLTAVQLDDKLGAFLTEQLGVELERRGAEVVTSKEIASLIGFERQKQLLSCEESSSCVAELGNALGADALVVGDVARVGTRFQLTVKALSTSTGKSIASWTGGADNEAALLQLVSDAAFALAPEMARSTGRTLAEVSAPAKTSRDYAVYPAVAGGVLLAGAIAAEVIAYGHYQRLTDPRGLEHADAVAAANAGRTWQSAFAVGASVGVAALAAGAAMYFLGGDSNGVSLAVSPEGAALVYLIEVP